MALNERQLKAMMAAKKNKEAAPQRVAKMRLAGPSRKGRKRKLSAASLLSMQRPRM